MFEFENPVPLRFPLEAQSLLEEIRKILLDFATENIRVVAGGGVLRDLYLKRPYKDIDLFLNAADASDEKVIRMLNARGFDCRVVVSNEATEYLDFADVASVIEAVSPNLPAVQIVRMSQNNLSGERMIERLDLGPCQIGMDYTGHFWCTVQFQTDVSEHQFTATRGDLESVDRSKKRFERLLQKYPGWRFEIL